MSYENAPATKMLATACACCARPLLDAASVEAGMGPICRKRHGYTAAQREPNWTAVAAAFEGCPVAELALPFGDATLLEATWRLGGIETRRIANRVVYYLALHASGLEHGPRFVTACVNAIRALGFEKLADALVKRLATVRIAAQGLEYVVEAPYSPETVAILRAVPGRRFDRQYGRHGANRFPVASREALFGALKRAFPGATASGPRGLFILAA